MIINYNLEYRTSGECEWYEGPAYQIAKINNQEEPAAISSLFPNPAVKGHFYLNLLEQKDLWNSDVVIEVYALSGKLVFEKKLDQDIVLHEINSDTPEGMYLVVVKEEFGEKVEVHRLVIADE